MSFQFPLYSYHSMSTVSSMFQEVKLFVCLYFSSLRSELGLSVVLVRTYVAFPLVP